MPSPCGVYCFLVQLEECLSHGGHFLGVFCVPRGLLVTLSQSCTTWGDNILSSFLMTRRSHLKEIELPFLFPWNDCKFCSSEGCWQVLIGNSIGLPEHSCLSIISIDLDILFQDLLWSFKIDSCYETKEKKQIIYMVRVKAYVYGHTS